MHLPLTVSGILSAEVTLKAAAPINEADPASTGLDDRQSNLTVDFGLVLGTPESLAHTGADLPLRQAGLLFGLGLVLLLACAPAAGGDRVSLGDRGEELLTSASPRCARPRSALSDGCGGTGLSVGRHQRASPHRVTERFVEPQKCAVTSSEFCESHPKRDDEDLVRHFCGQELPRHDAFACSRSPYSASTGSDRRRVYYS